jgi:site-specific DNA-methyltransferase (adenine-specific)
MIKASCPVDGVVFDPFMGSGTTAVAAKRLSRKYIGFEINPKYCDLIQQRLLDADTLELERNQAVASKPATEPPKMPKQETLFEPA